MANFTDVGVVAVVKDFKDFQKKMGAMDGSIQGLGGAGSMAVAGLKAFGVAVAAAALAAGTAAVAIGIAGTKVAIDWEDAFADVVRTTNNLSDEFGNLTPLGEEVFEGLRNIALEIPVTFGTLAEVAAIAGKMGIAEEHIVGFTETMARMSDVTDLSATQAAGALAQFAAVMGTGGEDVSRLASTIVALGNAFPPSEAAVVRMIPRLAFLGKQAGLSEVDVLAMATASQTLGFRSEAASTAFVRAFLKMGNAVVSGNEDLAVFAAASQLTVDEFSTLFEEDALGAYQAFIAGLGEQTPKADQILQDLGMASARYEMVTLGLAASQDILADAWDVANDAWIDNTALTIESQKKYGTLAKQLDLLKNVGSDVLERIGDPIKDMLKDWIAEIIPAAVGFSKNLPGAINKHLIPALTKFSVFVRESLIPAIAKLAKWLIEDLPKGISKVAGFWENTLRPALVAAAGFISAAWQMISPHIEHFINFLIVVVKPIVADVANFIRDEFAKIQVWFENNWPQIQETVQTVLTAISNFIFKWGPQIATYVDTVWTNMKDAISTAITVVQAIIETVMALIAGDWEGAWEGIQKAFQAVVDYIVRSIKRTFTVIKSLAPIVWDVLQNIGGAIEQFIRTGLQSLWDKWSEVWSQLGIIARALWDEHIKPWLAEKLADLLVWGADFVANLKQGVSDNWESFKTLVSEKWEEVKANIAQFVLDLKEDGKKSVDNLKAGYEEQWGLFKESVKTKFDEVKADIKLWVDDRLEDGKELVKKLLEGLNEEWENFKQEFKNKRDDIVTELETWTADRLEDGKELVNKIWEGIQEAWGIFVTGFQASLDEIPILVQGIGQAMYDAGTGLVGEIWNGVEAKWAEFMSWFSDRLSDLTSLIPFRSPPQDKTSPLTNLFKGGKGIITELMRGMVSELPNFFALIDKIGSDVEKLFSAAGVFGGLGNIAASMFEEQTLKPLEDAIDLAEDGLKEQKKILEDIVKEIEKFGDLDELLFLFQGPTQGAFLSPGERLWLERYVDTLGEINDLQEELNWNTEQYALQNEAILELQRKQQQLDFLGQQFALLELIREHGLDAAEILGGLKLGVDANLADVIDAMVAAMAQIIDKINAELEMGSPSKVFKDIGENMMLGLLSGWAGMADKAQGIMGASMVPAPVAMAPVSGGTSNISSSQEINIGPNTISNGMEMAQFEQLVLRVVGRDMAR